MDILQNENNYLNLMRDVLFNGVEKGDRTGTGTLSLFGPQLEFNLSPTQDGFNPEHRGYRQFPLLTTKKIYWEAIVYELLWFIQGSTNIKYLQENNVHIWDEWASADGELGPVYGKQWRSWPAGDGREIDQLMEVQARLKSHPDCRRHIVSAWNVGELDKMALPPCHLMFQFYVANNELSCKVYQRSADLFLGVPFNIASYALLTHMMAQVSGLKLGKLIMTFGDVHLYKNHLAQAITQLRRTPKRPPVVNFSQVGVTSVTDFRAESIFLENYDAHPLIKAPVAV